MKNYVHIKFSSNYTLPFLTNTMIILLCSLLSDTYRNAWCVPVLISIVVIIIYNSHYFIIIYIFYEYVFFSGLNRDGNIASHAGAFLIFLNTHVFNFPSQEASHLFSNNNILYSGWNTMIPQPGDVFAPHKNSNLGDGGSLKPASAGFFCSTYRGFI